MVNGKMCVSTGNSELMVRIDPALHDQLVAKPGCRAMTMKGKEYKGYILINEDRLHTKNDLTYWLDLALDFNAKGKVSHLISIYD